MPPPATPHWVPPLVWAGIAAVCGALFVIGILLGELGIAGASPHEFLGGGFFFWAGYQIAHAAQRGHPLAQGALVVGSFVLMAVMADGWQEPMSYLAHEPFRFADGLLRALPGLALAAIFAGRLTSGYFAQRRSQQQNRVN